MKKDIILSIHPEWVEKIKSGEKTVELRKKLPENLGRIFVYETKPTMQIVGELYYTDILNQDIYTLYDSTEGKTGVDIDRFLKYFDKKEKGYGIIIKKLELFKIPLKLKNPPQNYKFV